MLASKGAGRRMDRRLVMQAVDWPAEGAALAFQARAPRRLDECARSDDSVHGRSGGVVAKAFYQSIHYEPLRERSARRSAPGPDITLSDADPRARAALLDYFAETSVERVGTLRGNTALQRAAVDRPRWRADDGLHVGLEDWRFAHYLDNEASQPELNAQLGDDRRLGPIACCQRPARAFHRSL